MTNVKVRIARPPTSHPHTSSRSPVQTSLPPPSASLSTTESTTEVEVATEEAVEDVSSVCRSLIVLKPSKNPA